MLQDFLLYQSPDFNGVSVQRITMSSTSTHSASKSKHVIVKLRLKYRGHLVPNVTIYYGHSTPERRKHHQADGLVYTEGFSEK